MEESNSFLLMFPGYSHRIGKMQHTKLKLILLSLNDPIFVGYCYNNLNLLFVLSFNGFHNKNAQHEILSAFLQSSKKLFFAFGLKQNPIWFCAKWFSFSLELELQFFSKINLFPKLNLAR